MSEQKWTPGKWRFERDEYSGIEKYGVYAIDETPVVSHFTAIEHEPDAHLIAAAPDLYEALEACLNELMVTLHGEMDGVWSPEVFESVEAPYRKALAKARGESQ